MPEQLDGTCFVCGETYSQSGMTPHLKSCVKKVDRRDNGSPSEGILIRATAKGPPHWLYMLAPRTSQLSHIDDYLRRIWLECCGHLSEFEVGGARYAPEPSGFRRSTTKTKSMRVPLEDVIDEGMEFSHIYDFGSSTRLGLTCYEEVPWPSPASVYEVRTLLANPIWTLARNEPPELVCSVCGDDADQICTNCGELVCDDHDADHDCGYPSFLPVVNSPRMGVCGYTGPEE